MLYRYDHELRTPLLALDSGLARAGVPVVPAQWEAAPGSVFRVRATAFRHVVGAPAGDWVAWETMGTHELLGVVPGQGGDVVVVDFYFDSSARELLWAPAGRFLAAFYTPPGGYAELRVYEARTGTRLSTPWGQACRQQSNCQVVRASWTGPATIAVKTTAREYQTDVSRL